MSKYKLSLTERVTLFILVIEIALYNAVIKKLLKKLLQLIFLKRVDKKSYKVALMLV